MIIFKQKKASIISRGFLILNLAGPILPVRYQTSTFGVVDLTSVFGMGTGVTLQLYPPGNFLYQLMMYILLMLEIFASVSLEL